MAAIDYLFLIKDSDGNTVTSLGTGEVPSEIPVLGATVENKISSYDLLTLEMPADSEKAALIEEEMTVLFEDVAGNREYIINEIEDEDSSETTRKVTAELSSIELLDEIVDIELSGSRSAEQNLRELLEGTRWQVGSVDSAIYNQAFNENVQFKSVLDAIDLLSSKYGCEVQFSYSVSGSLVTSRYVNLYRQFGLNLGKRFEVGKDVETITRTIDTTNIKTAIYPYMWEREENEDGEEVETDTLLTIENVEWSIENRDPVDKPLGQRYIHSPLALEEYGRTDDNGNKRNRFLSMEFQDETEESMLSMAWVQLGRYTVPKVTYEANVVDLFALTGDSALEHERVALGDTAVIIDDYFSRPIEISTRIVELQRDLLDPQNNEVVLGESKQYFNTRSNTQEVEDIQNTLRRVSTEVRRGIEQIDGAGGNNNYLGSNQPENPSKGDVWFQPDPERPNETILKVYNGTDWEAKGLNSEDLQNLNDELNQAKQDIETARDRANEAYERGSQGIEEAEKAFSKAVNAENGLESKLDDSDFQSYKIQTSELIGSKVESEEFSSYRTQTDNALISKVSQEDFDAFEEETESQISQFAGELDFMVKHDDVVRRINLSEENILIDSDKIILTGDTLVDGTFTVTNDMVADGISANKINTGTLDADRANIINLNAESISAGDLNLSNIRMVDGDGNVVMRVDASTGEVEFNVSKLTIGALPAATEDYASSKASSAESSARSHANNRANSAENNAKAHADEKVDNLDMGTTNLISNTSAEWQTIAHTVWYADLGRYTIESLGLVAGETYTLGIQAIAGEYGVQARFRWEEGSNNFQNDYGNHIAPDKEGRTIVTASVPERATHVRLLLNNTENGNTYNSEYKELMLVRGNKIGSWQPAISDTEEKINSKADQEFAEEIDGNLGDLESVAATKEELGDITSALNEYLEFLEENESEVENAKEDISDLLSRTSLVENNLGEFVEDWNFLDTYIRMGDEGLMIQEKNGATGIRITTNRIDFLDGQGEPVAYITNQVMRINRGIFADSAQIGEIKIETISGGHTIFTWIN